MMETIIPRMRTIKEVVEATGLSYGYVRNLCLGEKIVFVRAGNKYLINLDKLIEFLNNGQTSI